jgi:hypothetical protein
MPKARLELARSFDPRIFLPLLLSQPLYGFVVWIMSSSLSRWLVYDLYTFI